MSGTLVNFSPAMPLFYTWITAAPGKGWAAMPSFLPQNLPTPQLFTIRVWLEPLGGDRTELRGQVRHVLSGETRYFREWPALLEYLAARLDAGQDGEPFGEIVE